MKERGEIDGEFESVAYRILNERDSERFRRYTTQIWINDKWIDACPCSLWYSGPRWEKELSDAIKIGPWRNRLRVKRKTWLAQLVG